MGERMLQQSLEVLQVPEDEACREGRNELIAGVLGTNHPFAERQRFQAGGCDHVAGAAVHKHLNRPQQIVISVY